MPHQAKLPDERVTGRASPANDPTVPAADAVFERDDAYAPARAPLAPIRFGRLALWMASATALGIGVLGTVAYSMWFTHDQRVYAEAMASARKTLGIEQPALAQTQSGGAVEAAPVTSPPVTSIVTIPAAPATPETTDLAEINDTDDSTTFATVTAPSGSDSAPVAQGSARKVSGNAQTAAVPMRTGRSAQTQAARRHVARAKSDTGLFARMGAFFHRVSYQQQRNGTSRQREEYSRP
ncbi:hypothetical protein [Caballeronia sp. BR00000012568055]|uniref:hypothetical protein n=1 Tax=Caballeronia sp. BR00000012568055 TaxID=2918761 RepID=UPI0023F6BD06|nr:hypothetical protein [Caballeronia sp. BR00000012568055]